ncbi:hypothetical protein PBAC_23180 [Pedobacter glucosidilyticus]|nr:hypothetical protein [Pedobacter glucosidilyticus]KHJ37474.1 hypothetical protein PBAC_23180 [Pedobacter glucosidilyticus]
MKLSKLLIIITLLTFNISLSWGQCTFNTSTIHYQQRKLANLYNELMREALSIKVLNRDEFPIITPHKRTNGEATLVYKLEGNNEVKEVLITEFRAYGKYEDKISVQDYIIFVDGDKVGFDYIDVKGSEINIISKEIILHILEHELKNRKFSIIKPNEKNLKYMRVNF